MTLRGHGRLATAIGLGILPFLVYIRILLPGWAPIGYDAVTYFTPLRGYLASAWREGRPLPLWDPGLFLGAPFLANIQDATLYPLSLLFLLTRPEKAFAWSIAIHLAIAGTGMFTYALRAEKLRTAGAAAAAAAYMLGGYMNSHLGHLNQMNTLAWTPWLMLAVDRLTVRPSARRVAAVALLTALVVLAGHTQQAYFSFLLAGLVGLRRIVPWALTGDRRRALGALALAVGGAGLGAAISALQLVATLELTRLSIRSGGLSLADAGAFSAGLHGIVGTLLPDYSTQQNTETTAYVGMAALVLALFAVLMRPHRRWLLVLGALAVLAPWAALGPKAYLYTVLFHLVPGIGLFRVPGRLLLFSYVPLALLAGHGVRTAEQLAVAARRRPASAQVALAAGAAVVLLALLVGAYKLAGWPPDRLMRLLPQMPLKVAALQALFAAAAALLVALPTWRPGGRGARWALAALPVLVAVEMVAASTPTELRNPEPESVYERAPQARELVPDDVNRRFLSLARRTYTLGDIPAGLSAQDQARYEDALLYRDILHPDTSLDTGLLAADGYDGGILPLASFVAYRAPVLPPDSPNNIDFPIISLTDRAYSVQWLRDTGVATVVTTIGSDPNPAGCSPCLEATAAAGELEAWTPPGTPPTRAYVEEASGRRPASITQDAGETVRISVPPGAGGELVLADAWYPGWQATVDGRPATVDQVQGFLRGVKVGPGAHTVVFEYRPRWLVPGIAISLLALLSTALLALLPERRR